MIGATLIKVLFKFIAERLEFMGHDANFVPFTPQQFAKSS